jgi:membrane protein DedA with SNARE-associated domain
MLESFYGFIFQLFQGIDYTALFVMMLIESSMIPFPSEIPLLAIGINAAKGTMNPVVGLAVSLIAIFIGASVNYALWRYVWDVFFEKYGKYLLIKKHAYHEAKKLYAKDANFYTFYGRLIPLVRQLMSLPAGMVRMPFWKFMSLTLAGSCIWHIIVISLGYFIGDNSALISNYITGITVFIVISGVLYFWLKHRKLLKKMLQ